MRLGSAGQLVASGVILPIVPVHTAISPMLTSALTLPVPARCRLRAGSNKEWVAGAVVVRRSPPAYHHRSLIRQLVSCWNLNRTLDLSHNWPRRTSCHVNHRRQNSQSTRLLCRYGGSRTPKTPTGLTLYLIQFHVSTFRPNSNWPCSRGTPRQSLSSATELCPTIIFGVPFFSGGT